MISVADIKRHALNVWNRGDVLRSAVTGAPEFPQSLRFKKTGGQHSIDSFAEIRKWVSELNAFSKERVGFGFTVEFTEINHRKLGRQNLPTDIRFDTPEDIARFIGHKRDFQAFLVAHRLTENRNPVLAAWMSEYPMKTVSHLDEWEKLLDVCEFVQANPKPSIYLRQLPVLGVDTKFIGAKRSILSDMLMQCLPDDGYDASVAGLARYGFERRFGFLYDEPTIRFRVLDDSIFPGSGYRDISVPIGMFSKYDVPGCRIVFITENIVNGLAFPQFNGGIVIFGLGYGVGDIVESHWLRDKRLVYWGDIDTHGYGILSMLRGKFPHVESILMSSLDLDVNCSIAVSEPPETRRTDELPNLTPVEREAYVRLLPGGDRDGLRIEQERIPFTALMASLASLETA
jgi:hypothetical protein